MKNIGWATIKTRLALAAFVAVLVIGVCLNVTWNGAGRYIGYPQMFTRITLKETDVAIKAYRGHTGTYPQKLSQLNAFPKLVPHMMEENGVILDAWRQPVEYKLTGDKYFIVSYGRDGKPGGVGLDCDLSQLNPNPPEAELPLLQVLYDPLAGGMVTMSIISGILTFLLTFSIVKPSDLSWEGSLGLVAKLIATLFATGFVAMFITAMHVPSGH